MGLSWEPCGQTAPNRAPNIAQRLPEAQRRSGRADAAPTAVFHVKPTLHTSAAAVPSSGLNRVLGGQNSLALKMQKSVKDALCPRAKGFLQRERTVLPASQTGGMAPEQEGACQGCWSRQ